MGEEIPLYLAIQATADGARLTVLTPEGEAKAVVTLGHAELRVTARALMAAAGDGAERTFTPEKARG